MKSAELKTTERSEQSRQRNAADLPGNEIRQLAYSTQMLAVDPIILGLVAELRVNVKLRDSQDRAN